MAAKYEERPGGVMLFSEALNGGEIAGWTTVLKRRGGRYMCFRISSGAFSLRPLADRVLPAALNTIDGYKVRTRPMDVAKSKKANRDTAHIRDEQARDEVLAELARSASLGSSDSAAQAQ